MTINTSLGGKSTPVQKEIGICWYAEASNQPYLVERILERDNLEDILELTPAGGIHPDGITIENESGDEGDPEILRDWSGNKYDEVPEDSTEGNNTLSFSLLEVLNPDAMRLVYKNVVANVDDEEFVSEINGFEKPTDKLIVIEYAIKGHIVREIFPNCSFVSRESFTIANSELAAHGVTYKTKDVGSGEYYKRVYKNDWPFPFPRP